MALEYGMVWLGMARYGMVLQYGTTRYGMMLQYGTARHGMAGDQMPRLTACPAFFTQWKAAGGIWWTHQPMV